jgi:hypothetical protein
MWKSRQKLLGWSMNSAPLSSFIAHFQICFSLSLSKSSTVWPTFNASSYSSSTTDFRPHNPVETALHRVTMTFPWASSFLTSWAVKALLIPQSSDHAVPTFFLSWFLFARSSKSATAGHCDHQGSSLMEQPLLPAVPPLLWHANLPLQPSLRP